MDENVNLTGVYKIDARLIQDRFERLEQTIRDNTDKLQEWQDEIATMIRRHDEDLRSDNRRLKRVEKILGI